MAYNMKLPPIDINNDDIVESGLYLNHKRNEYQLWHVDEDEDRKEVIGWTVIDDVYADILLDDYEFICMSKIDSVFDIVDAVEVN